MPEISGFAVAAVTSGASLYVPSDPYLRFWNFETLGSVTLIWDFAVTSDGWTYEIRTAAVPLPASLPLLLAVAALRQSGRR